MMQMEMSLREWSLCTTEGSQGFNVTAFKADGATVLEGSSITVTATALPNPLIPTSVELFIGGG